MDFCDMPVATATANASAESESARKRSVIKDINYGLIILFSLRSTECLMDSRSSFSIFARTLGPDLRMTLS